MPRAPTRSQRPSQTQPRVGQSQRRKRAGEEEEEEDRPDAGEDVMDEDENGGGGEGGDVRVPESAETRVFANQRVR